jgi:hypothetical protein
MQRALAWGGGIVIALGAVVVAGAALVGSDAFAAIRGAGAPSRTAPSEAAVIATPPVAEPAPAQPPAATTSAPVSRSFAPIIAPGRTALRDSTFAERSGDTVVVHFDTPQLRTRRRDKLEQVVRATLPAVYGAAADSALGRIAPGQLVQGDVVHELPTRGLQLPLANGSTLALYPETRPGRDGPLVVAYRVSATR